MTTVMPSKLNQLLSLLVERYEVRRAGSEWRTCCPAHNDNGPSLYVAVSPDRNCILLNCKAGCNTQDIVNALGLEFDALFLEGDEDVEVDGQFGITDEPPATHEPCSVAAAEPACNGQVSVDAELRHQVYLDLLDGLTLSDEHRRNLHGRGLTDDAIERFGYKTAERFAVRQALGQLKQCHDDEALLAVPGFWRDEGRVRFTDIGGLLVPVRDRNGRIVALKIRRDASGSDSKYLYVSSVGNNGPSPGSPPHVPVGTPQQAQTCRVTEGELKADIAFQLSGMPTIGVPGVASWRSCVGILAALHVGIVHLAFDQDCPPRPGVLHELRACANLLIEQGFDVRLERWDSEGDKYKGIDDLLAAGKQPEVVTGQAVLAAIERMLPAMVSTTDEDERPPAELPEERASFPIDCFPGRLQQFACEAAASFQCPVDFVTVPMLAVAGAAIGTSRSLLVREGYQEGARIYAAIVARPGAAKSPALKAACTPIYAQQSELRDAFRRTKQQYEVDMEAFEENRKTRRKGTENDAPVAEKPAKPMMQHLFVSDVTTEALAQRLEQSPRGLVLIRDELTGWVHSLNQYRSGRGADRQFYLSCWSGEPAKVDRKGDGGEPLIVVDPFLCVVGCVPPGKLSDLDARNECEDGFVHRVLFSYPREMQQRRWQWQGLSQEPRQLWKDTVEGLYALEMTSGEDCSPAPRLVQFAPESRPSWEQWYNAHNQESEANDFPDMLIGPWSKLVAYAARFALIIHLLRKVCGEVQTEEVDAESLRRAIRLIDYFKSHARVVYRQLHSPSDGRIQRVIEWIKKHGGACTSTQLAKNNVAGIAKRSDGEKLLRDLQDLGYGECQPERSANNRPVTRFVRTLQAGQSGSKRVETRSEEYDANA